MAPPAGRNPCWGKNGSMLKRADARPLFFGASWGVSRSGARYFWHCCGAQNFFAASRRALEILTAATRSPRFIRHRRRSDRSLRRPTFPSSWKSGQKSRKKPKVSSLPCALCTAETRFCVPHVRAKLPVSFRQRTVSATAPLPLTGSPNSAFGSTVAAHERQRRKREVSSSYGATWNLFCDRVGKGRKYAHGIACRKF